MTEYDKTEIQNKVEELDKEQKWNHCIELPYGVKTAPDEQVSHGKNIVKWSRIKQYVDAIDIKGKRVLDIGCNEGFFSLKLKELKAGEVMGVDADELRIKKAKFVAETPEIASTYAFVTTWSFKVGVPVTRSVPFIIKSPIGNVPGIIDDAVCQPA